ncbi:unnamed protein product [Caenorhabditis sp. 36 PRJEB53466]|nr:unnamed protein product [Caenorhabditis sp. 36 PRJEB53466]
MATTRRSESHLWWLAPLFIIIVFATVADSMSIPLREVILQWSDIPDVLSVAYQRPPRSFNMGPDVVHEKPRPLRFG